jgi:regulator of sigma E protease
LPLFDALVNIVLLLAILVVLVVVHEFGHFAVARAAGVKVHEFGVGFPPRARILARDRETLYTLNWLPIGGFVRLEGEEGSSDDPRSFVRQPLPTRLAILLAGVLMNFLLAWVIFSLIAGFADPTIVARVDTVEPGSPAARAGLVGGKQIGTTPRGQPIYDDSGDVIIAMDGKRFSYFDDITATDAPRRYLRERTGQTVTLTIRRSDGQIQDVRVTLRSADQVNERRGALGVGMRLVSGEDIRRDALSAMAVGLDRTRDASLLVLAALRDLVADLARPNVAGPVGIVGAVATVRTELPPVFLPWLIGLLSANLAVVNVLPLPPMDGGRIAVTSVQALTGNRISVNAERAVYLAGFVFLMAFLVWITYFDIQRLAGGS